MKRSGSVVDFVVMVTVARYTTLRSSFYSRWLYVVMGDKVMVVCEAYGQIYAKRGA